MKTVKEVSDLTGISVRTLHYYDQIGLLHPEEVTDSGYRLYGAAQLQRLQQILFLKELRFPLKEIEQILNRPDFEPRTVLQNHQKLLILQRDRLNALIDHVEQIMKGECTMSFTAFDQKPIEEAREKYASEVQERWGNSSAYSQSEEKAKKRTSEDWKKTSQKWKRFFLNLRRWPVKKKTLPVKKHKNWYLPGNST